MGTINNTTIHHWGRWMDVGLHQADRDGLRAEHHQSLRDRRVCRREAAALPWKEPGGGGVGTAETSCSSLTYCSDQVAPPAGPPPGAWAQRRRQGSMKDDATPVGDRIRGSCPPWQHPRMAELSVAADTQGPCGLARDSGNSEIDDDKQPHNASGRNS
uniref:Uncharacterized protein n=1 Tax=Arundo donax TaxID=35708 RepID=A0A0A9B2Y8_ARUDO